jgi:O-antigen/teichoic acid export membrane protein
LVYLFLQSKRDHDFQELTFKEISHNSFIAILSHISGFLTQRIFYFILPYFVLGVYSNALSVAESALILANSLSTYLYSKLSSVDNLKEQLKLTNQFIKINVLIMLAGYILILFIPAEFYVYFFGSDFSQVNIILRYAFPGVLFNSVHLIIGHFFSSRANFKINFYLTISGFICTLVFSVLLFFKQSWISVNSAALMYSTSYFFVFMMAMYFFIKQFKVNNEQVPEIN